MQSENIVILYAVISILWMITMTLIGVVYSIFRDKIKMLDQFREQHEKRIQRLDDVQGLKIDELSKKFDKMEQKLEEISNNLQHGTNGEIAGVLQKLLTHLENKKI